MKLNTKTRYNWQYQYFRLLLLSDRTKKGGELRRQVEPSALYTYIKVEQLRAACNGDKTSKYDHSFKNYTSSLKKTISKTVTDEEKIYICKREG